MKTIEIKSYLAEDRDGSLINFIENKEFKKVLKLVKKEIKKGEEKINFLGDDISEIVKIDELFDYGNLTDGDRLSIVEDETELIIDANVKLLLSKNGYYIDYNI